MIRVRLFNGVAWTFEVIIRRLLFTLVPIGGII